MMSVSSSLLRSGGLAVDGGVEMLSPGSDRIFRRTDEFGVVAVIIHIR